MKRIYKYPLKIEDSQIIELCGTPLSVEVQLKDVVNMFTPMPENIVLYAIIDDNHLSAKYEIRIHGTGHDLPDDINDYTFLSS